MEYEHIDWVRSRDVLADTPVSFYRKKALWTPTYEQAKTTFIDWITDMELFFSELHDFDHFYEDHLVGYDAESKEVLGWYKGGAFRIDLDSCINVHTAECELYRILESLESKERVLNIELAVHGDPKYSLIF